MIPVDVKDHIIVSYEDENQLGIVLNKIDDKQISIELPQDEENHGNIIVNVEDVVANIGTNPIFGEYVFGIPIEYELRRTTVENWGVIKYFRKMTKEQRISIKRCVKEVTERIMKTKDFKELLPITETLIKIYPGGKTVGTYQMKKDGDDTIKLFPEDSVFEDEKEVKRLLFHEFGHKVWMNMTPGKRYFWTNSFKKAVTSNRPTKEVIEEIKAIVGASASLKDAKKELPTEYRPVFKQVLQYINKNYKLGKYLDDLIKGDSKKIIEMWPENIDSIKWGEYGLSVTDYGNKSPCEDFCECFSYYMSRIPMDNHNADRIEKMLDVIVKKRLENKN